MVLSKVMGLKFEPGLDLLGLVTRKLEKGLFG